MTIRSGPLKEILSFAVLSDATRHHAKQRSESIALAFEGRVTRYGELERQADALAASLLAEGVKPGERVIWMGKNSDRYFVLLFATARIGAVLSAVGWRLAPAEAAYIVTDSDAKLILVGPEGMDQAQASLAEIPYPCAVVDSEGQIFASWLDSDATADFPTPDQNDVIVQLYTSGTTGRPKGVMLTHRNLIEGKKLSVIADYDWGRWSPDDVSLVAMPVSHIGGTNWGMTALIYGAHGVVAREFSPYSVLDYIERDRISKMFIVPAALQIVINDPRSRNVDYSRLKTILYGASPIPVDLLREAMAVFGCGFCQQYGMTETTGTIVFLPPDDHDLNGGPRMRAAGIPIPGVELRVVDADGNDLPAGAVGEVITRSHLNMLGYWKLDEATRATIDPDGWLHTGDAGYLDEDGYLFIHDRVKDMIISGGENIYPAEVENAIYGHPSVAEVAVIGVPDEKWGEAVKAIIVPRPGEAAPAENEIIAFARTRIAGFKAPKSVDFIEALPRNASGKILRRELRAPYWEGRERQIN